MKLLFKLALTTNWPSDKELRGSLNLSRGRFIVIRFAPASGLRRGLWAIPLQNQSGTSSALLNWIQVKANCFAIARR